MFQQIDNNLTGNYIYTGQGDMRRDPSLGIKLCDSCERCILHIGETVTVASLWLRNAYEGDHMVLAYVRGAHTGEYTHLPVGDLTKYIA